MLQRRLNCGTWRSGYQYLRSRTQCGGFPYLRQLWLVQTRVAPVSYWISCATGLPVRTQLERLVTGDRSNKLMFEGKRPKCYVMKYKLFD